MMMPQHVHDLRVGESAAEQGDAPLNRPRTPARHDGHLAGLDRMPKHLIEQRPVRRVQKLGPAQHILTQITNTTCVTMLSNHGSGSRRGLLPAERLDNKYTKHYTNIKSGFKDF
ncbi:MAG: hypothetical protein GC162_16760 [Planctomycetes bacterium]|nr:hypothetical protein [Planctomycetota bacterium]